jgi:hypothetical protein
LSYVFYENDEHEDNEDEDIGDYTSIENGRDITVDTVGPEVTGTKYNKSSVRVKPKTSPITENKEFLDKILTEQPDILTIYKKFGFDEMKKEISKFVLIYPMRN